MQEKKSQYQHIHRTSAHFLIPWMHLEFKYERETFTMIFYCFIEICNTYSVSYILLEYKYQTTCCDGRVVKALDLKSNGIFPRRFEPCSQRNCFSRFPTSSFISVWTERCALYNENENEKLGLVRDLNPGPLAP